MGLRAMPVNTGEIQGGRFSKGRSGNPAGKPRGARHRTTLAAEALLDGEAEALTRKAVEMALAGDSTAMRLCLDRILPPRRERPFNFKLPALQSAGDAAGAMAAIASAVGGSAPRRSRSFHCRSPANSVGDVTRQLERITLPSSDRQRIGLARMPFGLVPATARLLMRPRNAPSVAERIGVWGAPRRNRRRTAAR